jgi:hypothetical protein
MKRFLVIPVMLLYLFGVSGIMISLHYCGQTLESWSVFAKANGCDEEACGDESEQPDNCCKNEVIASKISQDQHLAEAFKFKAEPLEFATLPKLFYTRIDVVACSVNETIVYQSNAPPGLWQNIPLYKLHSRLT